MVSDTFNITALIIWIVRTIIYIFFIGIKQTVYIKPMITRVPVSISVGTRGTRELLMSLLVEALIKTGPRAKWALRGKRPAAAAA